MAKYHTFVDGSSRGNPGPGGWGVIVMNEDETKIIFTEHDSEGHVTNNRMELKAMICALGYAESHPNDQFIIYSDSAYVVNSITRWAEDWAKNNWTKKDKKPIQNLIYIQEAYKLYQKLPFMVRILQVPGHSNIIGNELADCLATNNINQFNKLCEEYGIKYIGED